jgi:DNA repair protein RadC
VILESRKCLYTVKRPQTLVHPREVYADALTDRTTALVVAHNHPSGKVEPSPEDRELTKRLMMAGDTAGV